MKYLFCILLIFKFQSGDAQNIRILDRFDKIPLSSQRYEVEGFMAEYSEFKLLKVNSNWELPSKNYIAIEYSGTNGEEINLFFKDGILYLKRLILNYHVNEQKVARDEYSNLKSYIVAKTAIVGKSEGVISNKVYGSQIGEGVTYKLTKSTKIYKTKSADIVAKLDFNYSKEKTTATIIGYKVKYECTDLSKTSLDAKMGYSSYEN